MREEENGYSFVRFGDEMSKTKLAGDERIGRVRKKMLLDFFFSLIHKVAEGFSNGVYRQAKRITQRQHLSVLLCVLTMEAKFPIMPLLLLKFNLIN